MSLAQFEQSNLCSLASLSLNRIPLDSQHCSKLFLQGDFCLAVSSHCCGPLHNLWYGSSACHLGLLSICQLLLYIMCCLYILPYFHSNIYMNLLLLCTALSVGGTRVLNANFRVTSPSDFSAAGVKWQYRLGSTAETLSASGTLTQAAVVEVLVGRTGNSVQFIYSYTLEYIVTSHTTQLPTTQPPTTTEPPTTQLPTTQPPTTTEPPTTQPPTTQPPTTQPPTTQPPTTQPLTTPQPLIPEPTITQPPTTQLPTTQPPTTQPPTTQLPTTQLPTIQPPTTQPFTTTQPLIPEPTITQPPTTQLPTTQPPTTQPPTTQPPTTQPPTTQQPTTTKLPKTVTETFSAINQPSGEQQCRSPDIMQCPESADNSTLHY